MSPSPPALELTAPRSSPGEAGHRPRLSLGLWTFTLRIYQGPGTSLGAAGDVALAGGSFGWVKDKL